MSDILSRLLNSGQITEALEETIGRTVVSETPLLISYTVIPGDRREYLARDEVEVTAVSIRGKAADDNLFAAVAEDSYVINRCLTDWRKRLEDWHDNAARLAREGRAA